MVRASSTACADTALSLLGDGRPARRGVRVVDGSEPPNARSRHRLGEPPQLGGSLRYFFLLRAHPRASSSETLIRSSAAVSAHVRTRPRPSWLVRSFADPRALHTSEGSGIGF